jgi:DNA-binding MarR family transcriptional regulator
MTTMAKETSVPKEVSFLSRVMQLITKNVYEEIPIQQIMLFFKVAENEGISMADLRKLTQISPSAISRNIKTLSTYLTPSLTKSGEYESKGLGLVDASQRHPINTRSFSLSLTSKGKRLLEEIHAVGMKVGI